MRFTRPSWVIHQDSSAPTGSSTSEKALTIFSLDVHPDDSRIATGGLDAKVRIWSTAPILNEDIEGKDLMPKSLATLTMHAGPVLCVRWANSGRWLASGSDDSVILIWDLDPHGGGKAWGSDDVNHEGWKALKRLPGHESDVTGLSWSPGDRYLASVGLDSVVIIWDGLSLERLQKLEHHSGFVKGVCWDPAGEYLASCSDDKSVKVFKRVPTGNNNPHLPSHYFELEAEITKPFVDSPANTFFRRLSWSPDGAHITVANATNGKGLVYVAAVISRRTWDSEISLVGHGHTVQAVAFNPHVFLRDVNAPVQTKNICSVVALGGDDCSVSVWATKSARPLVVARDAFGRGVLDLSWSSSGLVLYGCSSDGSIGVFEFSPEELEGMTTRDVQQNYLRKFPSYAELEASMGGKMDVDQAPQTQQQVQALANGHVEEQVTTLVARKGKSKNKNKRVTLESVPAAGTPGIGQPPASQAQAVTTIGFDQPPSLAVPSANAGSAFSRSRTTPNLSFRGMDGPPMLDPMVAPRSHGYENGIVSHGFGGLDDGPSVDSLHVPGDSSPPRGGGSYPRVMPPPQLKARTLGGDRVRTDPGGVRVLGSFEGHNAPPGIVGAADIGVGGIVLDSPPITNIVSCGVGDDIFEGRNSEDSNQPSEIGYVTGKSATTQWLDYLPSPVILLCLSISGREGPGAGFAGVGCVNGAINCYSLTGRRLMPTIMLGDRCAYLESARFFLMAVTVKGMVHVWNTKTLAAHHPPTSLLPLLTSPPNPNTRITSAFIRPNGAAVLSLSSGSVYSYDAALLAWVLISDNWWSSGSDAWNTRTGRSQPSHQPGVVVAIENSISEAAMANTIPSTGLGIALSNRRNDSDVRPPWWNTALTLGHLESRMHACRVLESGSEFKQSLLVYAKRIADEGFRAKAEEVVREFCGPVYWRPNRDDKWVPTICGYMKRDLLKDILSIFARSKTLTKLALDWQDTLKRAALED